MIATLLLLFFRVEGEPPVEPETPLFQADLPGWRIRRVRPTVPGDGE